MRRWVDLMGSFGLVGAEMCAYGSLGRESRARGSCAALCLAQVLYFLAVFHLISQVKEAKETEIQINENRNKYRNVAARGAMLFFLLNSLNKIHAFYQYSLNAFVTVFSRGLDLAPGGRKKKKPQMTLRQLSRRLSNTQAKDFTEVMQMARRQSTSNSRAGSQTGDGASQHSGRRPSNSGSQTGESVHHRASQEGAMEAVEEVSGSCRIGHACYSWRLARMGCALACSARATACTSNHAALLKSCPTFYTTPGGGGDP